MFSFRNFFDELKEIAGDRVKMIGREYSK